jgi:hypothetical protein
MDHRSRNPSYERNDVLIDEVDAVNMVAHVRLSDGSLRTISIPYFSNGGTVSLPEKGEVWVTISNGSLWTLDSRLENGSEGKPLRDMEPGDTRIRSSNVLHIDSPKVLINGNEVLGIPFWEVFTDLDQVSTLSLQFEPISNKALQLFANGRLMLPTKYSLTEHTIEIGNELDYLSGDSVAHYWYAL